MLSIAVWMLVLKYEVTSIMTVKVLSIFVQLWIIQNTRLDTINKASVNSKIDHSFF